jgi:hypothetical protein
MVALTAENLADALLFGGHLASAENFMLSEDADVPIYPEALVQVEVAKALKERLQFSHVELEANTEALAKAASGLNLGHPNFPAIGRHGCVDIVCWWHVVPQVFVEVKDQINGTDDGVVADVLRLQEFLRIPHRWGANSPQARIPHFGAILYYVGKNSQQYKRGRHLASQFLTYSKRSVETSLSNLRNAVDQSAFDLLVKHARVVDSAKNGPPDSTLVATEDEETVSGHEQFTVCIACVISPKAAQT